VNAQEAGKTLYDLYRRVEDVYSALEKRRQQGRAPLRRHTEELWDID